MQKNRDSNNFYIFKFHNTIIKYVSVILINLIKKISMTSRHYVYSVANGVNQDLIKKVEKLIVKRQAVFKQMNNYTLDKLSNIITETNQQLAYNVKENTIS